MRRSGLQVEITASLVVLLLGALALSGAVTAATVIQMASNEATARLRMGAAFLERAAAGGSRLVDVAALARASGPALVGGTFRVVDGQGRELNNGPPVPLELEGLGELLERARVAGEQLRVSGGAVGEISLVRRLRSAHGREGFLVGHASREQILAGLRPLLGSALWMLGIALAAFATFGAYLLRRSAVVPLQALAAATRRVAAADLAVRIPEDGPREIAELAGRFNEMAASLQREREALDAAHRDLSRSEKLATAGQLAAGVAHEVGNPVTAILGYAAVLERDSRLDERSREVSRRVRGEALRIQRLLRELLDLTRVDTVDLVPVELANAVRGRIEELRQQPLLAGVSVELELLEVPPAEADPARFDQILRNLVNNAAQSLASAPERGQIRVRVAPGLLPDRRGRRRGESASDRSEPGVVIEVIDSGPGISEENLPRVFDPFFTTKEPGEGTGLGLWNCHRMAELMGGHLEVTSEPGRTCFRLILRAADRAGGNVWPDPDHR